MHPEPALLAAARLVRTLQHRKRRHHLLLREDRRARARGVPAHDQVVVAALALPLRGVLRDHLLPLAVLHEADLAQLDPVQVRLAGGADRPGALLRDRAQLRRPVALQPLPHQAVRVLHVVDDVVDRLGGLLVRRGPLEPEAVALHLGAQRLAGAGGARAAARPGAAGLAVAAGEREAVLPLERPGRGPGALRALLGHRAGGARLHEHAAELLALGEQSAHQVITFNRA